MTTTTTTTNENKTPNAQFAPLIEFPEGGDIGDAYYRARIGMVMAHNFMIRGLNSIHAQADVPKTNSEKRSFAGYALCWCEFTHHHHAGEEKFFFPECEKRVPGSMVINVEQHCMFHDGFEAMESYFQQVQKTPSLYDGKKVLAMLDKFGQVFCAHLNDEIETLERSKLVAIFPNQKEFLKVWTDMMDWTISTSSKLTTLPWVMTHHEEATAPWFLKEEVPGIILFLARNIFPWFHYSYWRWSPCTLRGVLKDNVNVGSVKLLLKT